MTRHEGLQRLIIRSLHRREATPYDLHQEFQDKGISAWLNHLYASMRSMEKAGLLSGRWIANGRGQKQHLYSLTEKGETLYKEHLRESVDTLMGAFMHENSGPLGPHSRSFSEMVKAMGIPPPGTERPNVIFAVPSYDPVICYPVAYSAFQKAFPDCQVHVVQPPKAVAPRSGSRKVVRIAGTRDELPFRDGFADYLFLHGFPRSGTVEATLAEAQRVLKPGGHFFINQPLVLQERRTPRAENFGEFAVELLYRFQKEDREVDLGHVETALRSLFAQAGRIPHGASAIFHAVRGATSQVVSIPAAPDATTVTLKSKRTRVAAGA